MGSDDVNSLVSNPVKYVMQKYTDLPFGTDSTIGSLVSKLLGGSGD